MTIMTNRMDVNNNTNDFYSGQLKYDSFLTIFFVIYFFYLWNNNWVRARLEFEFPMTLFRASLLNKYTESYSDRNK